MQEFDVAIIGSGPGGYVAAIKCAQLGMKTAIIEKDSTLGGTCLNVGCIPSKALLDSSEHYYAATHKFKEHGINTGKLSVNLAQMMTRKEGVVSQMNKGVEFLMKKNKITVFNGLGSFVDEHTIEVVGEENEKIKAKNIIIATGSKPSNLPFINLDGERIITSTEALSLKEIPKHLVVIGGGVIGMELGSVYKRLGSKVSVVEYLDKIIPGMDGALSKELQRVSKKMGIEFFTSHKVKKVERNKNQVTVIADGPKEELALEGDYCLVAVGRSPYTEGLGAEKIGIELDEKGRILVNEKLQTKFSHIYALGDVVAGPMLAHKAEEEGVFVAEVIEGQAPHINYKLVPGVVYTWPEVSGIGYTEEELKEMKVDYKKGQFPFSANGRAVAGMDKDGFVKVLADKETDEVLGVHIIGPRAADLISEAAVAMEFRASAEDIARICHAHPTTAEALKEAHIQAAFGNAIHS